MSRQYEHDGFEFLDEEEFWSLYICIATSNVRVDLFVMLVMYHVCLICQEKSESFFEIMLQSPVHGCLSKPSGLDTLDD